MQPESSAQIFVSYSRRDLDVTQRLLKFLRAQGLALWFDHEQLIPGTPIWEVEIEKAIRRAAAVVVVLSPDSKESEWVRREVSLADQNRKHIFPVLVRGDEDTSISLRLITRQFIDLRSNETAGLQALLEALRDYLEGTSAVSNPEPMSTAAYTSSAKPSVYAMPTNLPGSSYLWMILGLGLVGLFSGYLWSEINFVVSGLAEALSGLVIALVLRKDIRPALIGWAGAGILGWGIGWGLLSDEIGAGIGTALFAAVGLLITFGADYFRSRWPNLIMIIVGWAAGGALGWFISRRMMIDNLGMDPSTSWAIGTAIGAFVAAALMSWQLNDLQQASA